MINSFLIDALASSITGTRKRVTNGFNINCPLCVIRGQPRPDTKYRCGIRTFPDGSVAINCFNCSAKTRWSPGQLLNRNIKSLLSNLGVDDVAIKKLNFTAWQMSHNVDKVDFTPDYSFTPKFETIDFPIGTKSLMEWAAEGCDDPDFLATIEYAMSRGEPVFDNYEFFWCPSKQNNLNKRLIIPFYWKDDLIGWTARAIDNIVVPRYHTNAPAHFLFNNQNLYKNRKFAILVEGIFDALSIEGVATQGAKLSEQQALWLKDTGKTIIVLPDRDEKGQVMIDLALKNDFMIAFPEWDSGIKDANDAVRTYGKLWTLKSIINCASSNKLKINLMRKKWN